jgi:hypothetical protein
LIQRSTPAASDHVHVTALRAHLEVRVGGSVFSGTYCYALAGERPDRHRVPEIHAEE